MFGKKLKELRTEKKITQKQIADLLNVSPSTVGMYEQGRRDPDTETIQKLADLFDVSIDYLLGRTDIRNPYIPQEYSDKHNVTKRDLKQYEDFTEHTEAFFMDDEVSEEDKERLFRDISELFWKSKEINKEKYGKKKKD